VNTSRSIWGAYAGFWLLATVGSSKPAMAEAKQPAVVPNPEKVDRLFRRRVTALQDRIYIDWMDAMLHIEIVVMRRIDFNWSEWFEGMTIWHTDRDETILSGTVADQAALYGLLAKLRNLGLPLISVNSAEMESTSSDASLQ